MATSFSAPSTVPTTKTVSCDATAGNLEQVTISGHVDRITLYFLNGDGKYTHTGTDGSAIGTDFVPVPGDQLIQMDLPPGTLSPVFYIAHTVDSGTCYVVAERWGR